MTCLPERLINSTLAALLFVSIYQAISLTLQFNLWLGLSFLPSAGLFIRTLLDKSPRSTLLQITHEKPSAYVSQIPVLMGLAFSWLAFLLSYSFFAYSSYSIHIEWLYLLVICTHLLASRRFSLAISACGILLITLIFLSEKKSVASIEHVLPLFIVFILSSLVSRAIEQLIKALNDAQTTDILTGCANSNRLKQEIKKSVELQHRYKTQVSCLTLSFKLKFEKYSQYEVWQKELAQVCQSRLRNTDTLCRYSDDRFIILLPSTDKDNAKNLGDDLLKACRAYRFSYLANKNDQGKSGPVLSYDISQYDGEESWESWLQNTANLQ